MIYKLPTSQMSLFLNGANTRNRLIAITRKKETILLEDWNHLRINTNTN